VSTRWRPLDPLESLARVAHSRREPLLRVHRRRLPHADLEDCYSQATLELLAGARRGRTFASDNHLANALAQRLECRIRDRRRALAGRSPMEAASWRATRLGVYTHERQDLADARMDLHETVCLREELRRLSDLGRRLSVDQRLVLQSQMDGHGCASFCARHGWTAEKYRKVAQRARARLRA
jgi:hypothetical protein